LRDDKIEHATRVRYATPGQLRLEEVDAHAILPQILGLRAAALGRTISLAPDLARWSDAHDTCASHWGVFQGAVLVAAARLSSHRSPDDLAESSLFQGLGEHRQGPLAFMSHFAVYARFRGLKLDGALDAARIERARQLRYSRILTIAETPKRAASLAALGFRPVGHSPAVTWPRRSALVLDLGPSGWETAATTRPPPRR